MVIEAVGHSETLRTAVEEVAFTGRVVYIGYAREPVTYETKRFVQKELDILGSRNALPVDFRMVIRIFKDKTFPVQDAVGSIVPPERDSRAVAREPVQVYKNHGATRLIAIFVRKTYAYERGCDQ